MASDKAAEVESERSLQKRSFIKSIRQYFREYCQCTSIHGFRYFGEKRTIFERIWWFITFCVVLGVLSMFIYLVYMKWYTSPVLVSFATTQTPIYRIPFPAVTICPETKAKLELFSYTNTIHKIRDKENLTEDELKYFKYMTMICGSSSLLRKEDFPTDQTSPDTLYNDLMHIFPPPHMWDCQFMDKKIDCGKNFKPIITEEGICFSFNILDRGHIFTNIVKNESSFWYIGEQKVNWNTAHGYNDDLNIWQSYPRRALVSGAENGLSIKMAANKKNMDYLCKSGIQGFKVVLHTPSRLPRPSQEYFRVPLAQVVVAAIQPTLMNTSEAVKRYDAATRQCFFEKERKLTFFNSYSQRNCEIECLANFTLVLCGCASFYLPRTNSTPLCGIGLQSCVKGAKRVMTTFNLNVETKNLRKTKSKKGNHIEDYSSMLACHCKPLCTELTYLAETSQTDWDWRSTYGMAKRMEHLESDLQNSSDNIEVSMVKIYFKSNHFITLERNELYGPTDFLANFGGLLGLFTGFSILSLMEIVYFLTVRLICNIRLYGFWAGPK